MMDDDDDDDEYSDNYEGQSVEPPSPSHPSQGADDASMDDGGSDRNDEVGGNSFTQIQSRRFFPRGNDATGKGNINGGGGGGGRGSSLPCRWSLCPTMDLVAVGIGGSVVVNVRASASSSPDGHGTTRTEAFRLDAAESVTVHRIQSWRALMSVGIGALASRRGTGREPRDNDDDGGDDDYDGGGVVCLEDIERECGASSALAAIVESDDGDADGDGYGDGGDGEDYHDGDEDDKCGDRGPTMSVGDEGLAYDENDVYNDDGCTIRRDGSFRKDEEEIKTGGAMNGATCLAWSPDGRRLAIGLLDGGVQVRSIEPHIASSASSSSTVGEGGGGDEALDVDGYASSSSHVIRPPPPPPRRGGSASVDRTSSRRRTMATTTTTTSTMSKNHGNQRVDANNGSLCSDRGGDIVSNGGGGSGSRDRRRLADFSPRVTRSMTRGSGGADKPESVVREGAVEGSSMGGRKSGMKYAGNAPIVSSTSMPRQVGGGGINVSSSKGATAFSSSLPSSSPVLGMTWNRLRSSRRHRWRRQRRSVSLSKCHNDSSEVDENEDEDEDEDEVEFDEHEAIEWWRYASQLIDRGVGHFLPDPHRHVEGLESTTMLRSMSSPRMGHLGGGALDVLCVATTNAIHFYLQGRYRILSVPHGLSLDSSSPEIAREEDCGGCGIDLVCSPDLGTLIACFNSGVTGRHVERQKVKLFCTALLPRKRFELQILSSSYTSLFSRLWDVKKGICEALTSWRTTLRPLDAKFNGLLKLLSDHGVDGACGLGNDRGSKSIRLEFLKFILCGRSTVSNASSPSAVSSSSSSTSALDQFFTRAQMHDTLLQREARMIETCASSTEVILRSHVLGSIRAIVYEAEELYGIAASAHSRGDERLVDVKTALCMYRASRALYLTFDQCLHQVVEARIRLHDLLAWMRGTAARIRAWGTAPDSIQRRNAKSLRVSNGVVQRVAAFLSCPMMFASKDCDGSRRILTECIIGVPLSDFFVKINQSKETLDSEKESVAVCKKKCSLPSALQTMFQLCTILFDKPRRVFAESVSVLDISFEVKHTLMSVHTRIGAGYSNASIRDSRNDTRRFFLPQMLHYDPAVEECTFWTVLARSLGSAIELIAIPGCSRFEQDTAFYLRAVMMMPEGHEVIRIKFYGDDGNSSLSPNLDEDSDINEGRQAIGFLVECNDPMSQEERTELWLFRYDDMIFQKSHFERTAKDEVIVHDAAVDKRQCIRLTLSDEEVRDVSGAHVPRRRLICTDRISQNPRRAQLSLCGSRGTGGVLTFGGPTCLQIFDLEEDDDGAS